MTELELYKFIENNKLNIEWHNDCLILWVNFWVLDRFTKMAGTYFADGEDENVCLKEHCVTLDIVPLCESYGIDPLNICDKEER